MQKIIYTCDLCQKECKALDYGVYLTTRQNHVTKVGISTTAFTGFSFQNDITTGYSEICGTCIAVLQETISQLKGTTK